jgi:acyl-CoA dehydrogenase
MDFAFSEAQRELGGLTREILADSAGPDFDRPLWTALGRAGVLAAALPKEAGGDGFGLLEQCTILVELGRAVAPLPYLPTVLGAAAIARFGDRAQTERWAVPAARGEAVLTSALGDEDQISAVPAEPGWTLTGSKTAVPALPYADLVLVPASLPDGSTAVFLVEPGGRGVSVAPQDIAGGAGAGWLSLSGAVSDCRLGGADVADWLLAHATVGLCALQLGVASRALEMTASYARTREQFGRPIGSFQAVAQRLANAYIDVEAIGLTMWQAAWRLSEGLPCAAEVATAKFWAAEGGHRVAHTAVHVHGGVGIDLSHPVHRYFLAAKHNEFALGGATAQLLRLGALL